VKSAIQTLEVSYLLHATEDASKVAAAVRGLVGGVTPFESEEMEGHFGNSIRKMSIHMHGEDAGTAFTRLVASMPRALRESVARDIDGFVDEHSSLYLRFDKQRLVEGEVASGYGEAVRLKVKPRAYLMHGGAKSFFLEQLMAK